METTAEKEKTWTTADGKDIPFSKLWHQHLSNIIWFSRLVNGIDILRAVPELKARVDSEFSSVILPWKPLPVPHELLWIRQSKSCTVDRDGNIWATDRDTIEYAGSVSHIPGWEEAFRFSAPGI